MTHTMRSGETQAGGSGQDPRPPRPKLGLRYGQPRPAPQGGTAH